MKARHVAILALLVAAEQATLHPSAVFRGEVLSDVALAYSMAPWKAHVPALGPPLEGNPSLSDDMALFTPWDVAVRQMAARHETPLWNADSGCGMPLLANDQSAVLALAQLPRLAWNSPHARTWSLLLKPIIAAIGMALLLAQWRLAPGAAVVGGLAWANSSAMTVWLLYPLAEVLAWFPWLLLGLSRLLGIGKAGSLRGGLLVAVGGAAMLLAGHSPTAVQLLIPTAAAVALALALLPEARRRAGALAASAVLALCLAAPQLLPTATYLYRSHARLARGGAAPLATLHLPIRAAWSWLVPRGFGSPEREGYRGPLNFNEATASVGVPALFLAVLALVLAPGRRELALGAAALVGAAAAYGVPPSPWLMSHLPLLRWVAGQRWLLLAEWAAAALAACGLQIALEQPRRRVLFATASAGAALLVLVSLHPAARSTGTAPVSVLAAREVVLAAALVLLSAGALAAATFGKRGAASPVLACLTLVAGAVPAWRFNPTIPPAAMPGPTAETETLDRLREGGRVAPIGWALRPDTGLLAGLPTTTGFDDFLPERYFQFATAARIAALDRGEPVGAPSLALLRRSATTLVVADRPLAGPGLEATTCCAPALWAARVTGAHTLAAWYPRALPVSASTDAFAILSQGGLADEDTVLVEAGSAPLPRGDGAATPLAKQRDDAARIVVRSDQSRDGIVVVREATDPGWSATLDGRSVSVLATDGMFMGVIVPRGPHTVVLAYRPVGWRIGRALAALALAVLLAAAVASVKRRKQPVCGAASVSDTT